jgi:hypothetical protein
MSATGEDNRLKFIKCLLGFSIKAVLTRIGGFSKAPFQMFQIFEIMESLEGFEPKKL